MARRQHNSRRNDPAPGWVWMLFGLGLGLLVAVGVYLRAPSAPTERPTAARADTKPKERPATKPAPPQPQPDASADEKRFQFYDILPQFEVVVPRQDTRVRPPAQRAPVQQPGRYLLQAGSFSAAAEADRLQATLALRGIESRVQQATVDGTVFYRVQIGPVDDLEALNRTRRQLLDAGIEPLPLKLRD
jgi:cell division protein FtsN